MFDTRGRRVAFPAAPVLVVCALVLLSTPNARAQEFGLHDVSASVVDITVLTAAGSRHICGFVVGEDGLIATNVSHLKAVESVTVRLPSGVSYNQISLHASDKHRDLVIFKVPATDLVPVPLGDSNLIKAGDFLQTTCCTADPMCADQWTEVKTSGVHEVGVDLIQFANPPVSWMPGAPILDRAGQVVGIANILLADQSSIAVTSNEIKGVLQNPFPQPIALADLIEFARSQAGRAATNTSGEVGD